MEEAHAVEFVSGGYDVGKRLKGFRVQEGGLFEGLPVLGFYYIEEQGEVGHGIFAEGGGRRCHILGVDKRVFF